MRAASDLTHLPVGHLLDTEEKRRELEAQDVLKYYKENFPEVYVLICDGCREKLAIEYVDPSKPNYSGHHQGRQVIAISSKFSSFRQRLDGAMGYKCACGNNTILAGIESGIVPVAKRMSDGRLIIPSEGMEIHPHHIGMVQERIAQLNYHPDIRLKGKDIITETFRVRRIA